MKHAHVVLGALVLATCIGCGGARAVSARQASAVATTQPSSPLEIADRGVSASGVQVVRLSNGLTVIIAENHNSPVLCVQAFVRTGSLYEGKYLGTGISHLTEHLVAEGAEKDIPTPSKKTNLESLIGGESNAYTSQDDTSYYVAAASSKTELCLDLISNWFARPKIAQADFEREHGVVQRELAMGLDDVGRQLHQTHAENVYQTHPAAAPVVGYQPALAALTFADVLDYHKRKYVPQNIVVVVVGDVQAEQALLRLRCGMASWQSGPKPELTLPEAPTISGTRRVAATNKKLTQAVQAMSFQSIPLVHEDLYALDVLSYILTQGETSILERTIRREKKLVTAIDSASWTPAWGKGEFAITFRAAPQQADAAEAAIVEQLQAVVDKGVQEDELGRAKLQKVSDFVYSRQTVQSQAAALGNDYLATGDVEFSRQYTDRIQKVTAQQVQAAAKKYFQFDKLVVTRLLPAKLAASQAASQPTTASAGETKFFKLPNGLRVVLHDTPSAELVSMVLATEGGLLLETPKTNGMGNLMASLATQGAGKMSAEEIADFFERAGGSTAGQCGNNTFYWQATVLADSFPKALPVFADIVLRPTYPQKELDIARPMVLDAIKKVDEGWRGLLNKHFRQDFFQGSPLGMLPIGSAEVVQSATVESIAGYHAQAVKAGSSVLAVYGRFDVASARQQVEKLFAELPGGVNKLPDVPPRQIKPEGETYVYPEKTRGAGIMVAGPGTTIQNLEDRLPLTVLDTIISGYNLPRGWLHGELRGKQLVYEVHAMNWAALAPGAFQVYAECDCPNATEVAKIIAANLRRTCSYQYNQAEIDEAVNFILTSDLLDNQEMHALAMQAALDELYGFGYDFRSRYERRLRQVKPPDLCRVAQKYLSGGMVMTVVTPQPETLQKGLACPAIRLLKEKGK